MLLNVLFRVIAVASDILMRKSFRILVIILRLRREKSKKVFYRSKICLIGENIYYMYVCMLDFKKSI